MLPFFGPSTLRDGVGLGVEFVADPVPYVRNRYHAVAIPSIPPKSSASRRSTCGLS